MAIHGFLRTTTDIDLIILSEDLDAVIETARSLEFDIEGLPLNFDKGETLIRRISKIDNATKELITLDLILATQKYADVWKARGLVKWNAGEYRVVSVAGMKVMKEAAARPKDLIDLDYLRGLDDED